MSKGGKKAASVANKNAAQISKEEALKAAATAAVESAEPASVIATAATAVASAAKEEGTLFKPSVEQFKHCIINHLRRTIGTSEKTASA